LLKLNTREVFPEDVAFRIGLPVLDGIDPGTLMSLRKAEADSFRRCQHALRSAIRERIRSMPDASASQVAKEIEDDVIAPALADVGRRLRSAERSLIKKTGVSFAVGSLTTTVGLLTGIPAVSAAGVSAALSSIPVIHKYFEQRDELRSSDLYFIWAGSHAIKS
jgi:hypothetical protein